MKIQDKTYGNFNINTFMMDIPIFAKSAQRSKVACAFPNTLTDIGSFGENIRLI
jgi:hypothetical protein